MFNAGHKGVAVRTYKGTSDTQKAHMSDTISNEQIISETVPAACGDAAGMMATVEEKGQTKCRVQRYSLINYKERLF